MIKWVISSRSAEQNKGTFTNAQEGILFHDAETENLLMSFLMSTSSLPVDVPVDANADRDSGTEPLDSKAPYLTRIMNPVERASAAPMSGFFPLTRGRP